MNELETQRPYEASPYQFRGEEIPPLKPKTPFKRFFLPVFAFFIFVAVAAASFYIYKTLFKPDPISLLPQETIFYLRVKINPENKQVKIFKDLLNKFPYYGKISQLVSEKFEEMKKEEPALKNIDFTISDEFILALVSQFDLVMEDPPLVFILPNPDLKKLQQISMDIKASIEKSDNWKIEEENYKGRTIVKAIPIAKTPSWAPPNYNPPEPTIKPATTFTNGHFFFSLKPEYLKKIIDVADDQEITNIFKKDKAESIVSGTAHKKMKKYLSDNFLTLFYGEFDLSETLKIAESIEIAEETQILSPLITFLKSALTSEKNVEESEKAAFAGTISAEQNELRFESCSLDLRENVFAPSEFSLNNSLAGFIPEKINNREITLYGEGSNLQKIFDYFEESILEEMTAEEKREFNEALEGLKEILGVDLKEDIIALFRKNYAFFVASEPSGEETPIVSLIFDIEDENKVKENFLKIKIPNPSGFFDLLGLEGSRARAKDARIMADMSQMRAVAEIIYMDEDSYQNVKCTYGDIKTLCDDIELQVGSKPTIHQSKNEYCAYAKLNELDKYFCVDSRGQAIETYLAPNYCTKTNFRCPDFSGPPPEDFLTFLVETISFSKETIDDFEIYSLPIVEEAGLYFSIKDKKLILTFTKEWLMDILYSLADSKQGKLVNSAFFAEHFRKAPVKVTDIAYAYPYGFSGAIKYLVNYYITLLSSSYISETDTTFTPEFISSKISELLDKGVAPYLKLLRSQGGYSYTPENGLVISKTRLIFSDLSLEEKKAAEDFWDNFSKWIEEITFGPRSKAKDARIMADMSQMRAVAEIIYMDEDSYQNVKCTYGDIKTLCDDIELQVGSKPTIHQSKDEYCAYTELNESGAYWCVDSTFVFTQTYYSPGRIGGCDGITFICP